jgi:DNA-binding transcriptional regulator YiaG
MKKSDPEIQLMVRTTRHMLGLSQEKFAKLFAGYTLAIVKNWESGRTLPRADVFLKILKIRKRCLRKSHRINT